MRFDVPLFTHALLGSAALAASIPRGQYGNELNEIEQIEEEIVHLEQELEQELADFEQLENQHAHHGHPGPHFTQSSASSASTSSSTLVSSAVVPSGSAATSSSSTILTTSVSSTVDSTESSSISTVVPYSSAAAIASSSVSSSAADAATTLAAYSSLAGSVNDTLASLTAALSSAASAGPVVTSNATFSSILAKASSIVSNASVVESTISSTLALYTTASSSSASASSAVSASSSASVSSAVSASSYASASAVGSVNASISSFVPSTSTIVETATVSPVFSANSSSTSIYTSASASSAPVVSSTPEVSANATSALVTGTTTATTASMAPTTGVNATLGLSNNATSPSLNVTIPSNSTTSAYCSNLCNTLSFSSDLTITPLSCTAYAANDVINVYGPQAAAGCSTTITPEVDICQVTLNITTSFASTTYMEVWLPNGNDTAWNGRTMSTDNGGLDGCVHYVDMQYVSGLGFAAIGDNGGHNSGAFDGEWMWENNEQVLDWAYRARHESVQAGKEVTDQFYGKPADYSYYIGCSTGGQQGLHSAQYFPDDFDGIIAGSSAADFEHLEDWSSRFIQFTGNGTDDPRFLTEDEWILVQSYIFAQCDEPLDGVADGILEDPTICKFDSSVMVCNGNNTGNCLTQTQVDTVNNCFSDLFDTEGNLLYPSLLLGAQVDAYRLGQLSGTVQGIVHDFYAYGVYNNSNFDALTLNQTDYAYADSLDAYHGNVSSFNGDLSAFQASGHKMIMYHGMADPLVSGANSQRYYLKVAKTLGIGNTEMDDFLRLFRISGMAHCGVGGISGAGAWMFGQEGDAAYDGVADNIVWNLVDWVEDNNAPERIVGTKFWYDTPSLGVEFYRPHCRFPYRTTYEGGDWTQVDAWGCTFIDDWQDCGVGALPRLCNADGSFGL